MLTWLPAMLTPAMDVFALQGWQMPLSVPASPSADDLGIIGAWIWSSHTPNPPASSYIHSSFLSSLCCKHCWGDEHTILSQHLEDSQCSMNQSPVENASRFSRGDGRKAHGEKNPNQAARPNLASFMEMGLIWWFHFRDWHWEACCWLGLCFTHWLRRGQMGFGISSLLHWGLISNILSSFFGHSEEWYLFNIDYSNFWNTWAAEVWEHTHGTANKQQPLAIST